MNRMSLIHPIPAGCIRRCKRTSTSNRTVWQYTSCGEIAGIKGDVDLDIAYEDPTAWSQPAVDPGVIYTVSVADVLTRGQAEIARQQFAARGIVGVVHKVKILG